MPDILPTERPGVLATIKIRAREWAPVVTLAMILGGGASALVGWISYRGQWPGEALQTMDSAHNARMDIIQSEAQAAHAEAASGAVLLRDLLVPMAKRDCYQVTSEFADVTNMKCDSLLGGNHWRRNGRP